jgi:hypothetical protein
MNSHSLIKAASGAVLATSLDAYLSYGGSLNSYLVTKSATFGAVVGGSFLVSDMLAPGLTNLHHTSNTSFFSNKTLEQRLIESALNIPIAVLVNDYIIQASSLDLMKKVGIIVLSDVVGETVADLSLSRHFIH